MIAIVSSTAHERAAFAALCESYSWACTECDSLRSFKKLLKRIRPRIVLTRQKLVDGYSDDIISLMRFDSNSCSTKTIVLISAGATSTVEARQISLGADCAQRDPVRTDVVLEYIKKYRNKSSESTFRSSTFKFLFAGGYVDSVNRTLEYKGKLIHLTPREVELSEILSISNDVLTYETVYSEIFAQKFKGDTSNLRVLLGKLDKSARKTGINLRQWIKVIPKLGYLYQSPKSEKI